MMVLVPYPLPTTMPSQHRLSLTYEDEPSPSSALLEKLAKPNPIHIDNLPTEIILHIISQLPVPGDLPALISSSPRILQVYLTHRYSILLALANTHTLRKMSFYRPHISHISFPIIQRFLEQVDRFRIKLWGGWFYIPNTGATPVERHIYWPGVMKNYYYHGRPGRHGLGRKMWDWGADGQWIGARSRLIWIFEGQNGRGWEELPEVVFTEDKLRLWKVLMYIETASWSGLDYMFIKGIVFD